jgi:predicted PurR-regulated permease PerM
MAHGLIGLFVGPIILSLGYELGRAWIQMGRVNDPDFVVAKAAIDRGKD